MPKLKPIERMFRKHLGETVAVRRYDASTDTFTETQEKLIVEPQSITYRPLNKYETSLVGQPIPIQRLKIYSMVPFTDFRDEVIWKSEKYRVRELSTVDDLVGGMASAVFVRTMKKHG